MKKKDTNYKILLVLLVVIILVSLIHSLYKFREGLPTTTSTPVPTTVPATAPTTVSKNTFSLSLNNSSNPSVPLNPKKYINLSNNKFETSNTFKYTLIPTSPPGNNYLCDSTGAYYYLNTYNSTPTLSTSTSTPNQLITNYVYFRGGLIYSAKITPPPTPQSAPIPPSDVFFIKPDSLTNPLSFTWIKVPPPPPPNEQLRFTKE